MNSLSAALGRPIARTLILGLAAAALSGCATGSIPAAKTRPALACAPALSAAVAAARSASLCAAPRAARTTRVAALAPMTAMPTLPAPLTAAAAEAPEVLAAEALRNAASDGIDRARAAWFPSVNLQAGAGIEGGVGAAYAEDRAGALYNYRLGVDVPLYEGGRIAAAVAAARSDFRAAGEVARDRRSAAAFELASALADGARFRETVAILQRQERLLSRLAGEVRDAVAVGAASQVDLDDVQRQQARIRVLLEDARFGVTQAAAVAARYGIAPGTRPPEPAVLTRTGSRAQILALALSENPRLREQIARIDSAQARVAQAAGELGPTLSIGAGIVGGDRSLPGVEMEHAGQASLQLSMPIFDGGLRGATLRQRKSEKLSAEFDRQAALLQVSVAIDAAVQRRDAAGAMLAAAQAEQRRANSALSGLREERTVGQRTTFDEIRAIENVAAAEINAVVARWQSLTASYVLATQAGIIDGLPADRLAAR